MADRLFDIVQDEGGRLDGGIEPPRIDSDAVRGAETLIAFPLKRGPRVDQGEVDVEEDRTDRFTATHESGVSGPATTTVA